MAAAQAGYMTLIAGVLFYFYHDAGLSVLCLGMFAALLGFLYWNWEPAKLFMGDVGSEFLGYFFAILMFASSTTDKIPVIFWFLLMAVFLCDTTYTLLYRIQSKKKWHLAHREHIYQRLAQSGFSHKRVVLFLILINIAIILPMSFVFLHLQPMAEKYVLIVLFFVMISIGWLWLHRQFPPLDSNIS